MGPVAQAAVPELVKALRDPKWGDVRAETKKRYTVMGMLLIPLESIEAIGAIDQRISVTAALRQIGPPEAVIPALAEAVCDANLLVANSAADELRELLPESEPAIRELMNHPDADVRARAEALLSPPEPAE